MAETIAKSQTMAAKSFKERHTFEERLAEARKKKEANQKLLPIIVERHSRSKLPDMEKTK